MPSWWRARAAEVLPAREQHRAVEAETRRSAVRPPITSWVSRSTCRTGPHAASSTICGKSRLVAATSRTFTRIVRVPPTRSNACCCSTRSTMDYTWSPPWARAMSKQPRRSGDGGRRAREEATGSSAAQASALTCFQRSASGASLKPPRTRMRWLRRSQGQRRADSEPRYPTRHAPRRTCGSGMRRPILRRT
jgi:hypothetical protein